MKTLIFLSNFCLLLTIASPPIAAQTTLNHLNQQPLIWLQSGQDKNGLQTIENVLTEKVWLDLNQGSSDHWLNFHPFPALKPSLTDEIPALTIPSSRAVTFFCVYRPDFQSTEEALIWQSIDGNPQLVVTTQRALRISDKSMLDFAGPDYSAAKILTYRTLLPAVARGKDAKLQIGAIPDTYKIPLRSFSGQIAELLVFDRFLSAQECQIIETQLALRYGISLLSPARQRYLAPSAEPLWTIGVDDPFHFRITGLGREDAWRLYQRQATNVSNPNLLTMWLGELKTNNDDNRKQLLDRAYLLWGDDDGTLMLKNNPSSGLLCLQRNWRIEQQPNFRDQLVNIGLNTRALLSDLPHGMHWWLVTDQSADGSYPISARRFYPIDELSPRGLATFRKLLWDTDNSGSDIFTLCAAPDFFAHWETENASCTQDINGQIKVGIVGGTPPFSCRVYADHNYSNKTDLKSNEEIWECNNLTSGEYRLSVTDRKGREFSGVIRVSDREAPRLKIDSLHRYHEGEELVIRPQNNAFSFDQSLTWTLPNLQKVVSPEITVTDAGWYQLEVDSAGCKSYWEEWIQPDAQILIRSASVYPNPSSGGRFNLEIRLQKATDLLVRILQDDGRLVKQISLKGHHYYFLQEHLPVKGNYRLQINTPNGTESLNLVVQ